MTLPHTGRCLCGATEYRLAEEPLTVYACHCTDRQNGTRLWLEAENRPALAVVRPGRLDDTSWLRPVAHLRTRSAQPWFDFPEGAVRYETQPENLLELAALWRNRCD
ncbi:MAG: hypothetical protein EPO27_17465 [Betaproteobacteria bacterium]|nr:MAG: hypothetical protein EPO27_17465 [Betaproteobacteria bacterium]